MSAVFWFHWILKRSEADTDVWVKVVPVRWGPDGRCESLKCLAMCVLDVCVCQRWPCQASQGLWNVECVSVSCHGNGLERGDPGKTVLDSKHPVCHPWVGVCTLRLVDVLVTVWVRGYMVSLFVSLFCLIGLCDGENDFKNYDQVAIKNSKYTTSHRSYCRKKVI